MTKSPLVYWSRPPMMFSRVVFPQPEGPRMETNSLSRNCRLTPFRASTGWPPAGYSFTIFFNSSMGLGETFFPRN